MTWEQPDAFVDDVPYLLPAVPAGIEWRVKGMTQWRPGTIARTWSGRATPENADAYARHAIERVFPALSRIRGHRGAYLLRRETQGRVEFLVLTVWESMQDVQEFAGKEPDRAVVEPEARAVLAEFDDFARHFEVIHGAYPE